MLKTKAIFFVLLTLITILPPSVSAGKNDFKPLGVHQLMENTSKYTGTTQVEGIVAQVDSDEQLIGLIDLQEFEDCNSVTCTRLILPVRWKGKMPQLKKHLLVKGLVGEEHGRMLFRAESLKMR